VATFSIRDFTLKSVTQPDVKLAEQTELYGCEAGGITSLSMASAGPWGELGSTLVDPLIFKALNDLGYPTMTPVQAAAIPPLLSSRDVAVDAETGSGKTLSFLVPAAQMLLFAPNTRCRTPSRAVRALVIVPTRELAAQVHAAAVALFATLPGSLIPVPLIGGDGAKDGPGPPRKYAADMRLVVATPGRLNAAINAEAISCRNLELLIMDEADRLLDMGFAVALTSILTRLPKQRRTGLYSATQTKEVEELARAGLRNPVRVAVRVNSVTPKPKNSGCAVPDSSTIVDEGPSASGIGRRVIPTSLTCFYSVVRHDHKLHHFCRLLAEHRKEKFIVYVLTCACVDFFAHLPLLEMAAKTTDVNDAGCHAKRLNGHSRNNGVVQSRDRLVLALHGKMSQSKRTRALDAFAKSPNAVLVCTDVAARGLDIPDVDWVVQFDAPQDPDAYVHRVGRTARLGRPGYSLIYLAPHEDAYADFLSIRKCPASRFESCEAVDDEAVDCIVGMDTCMQLTGLVRDAILADRAVLDAAEQGFLSYLRAYKEHRCSYLLPFANLDIGSVARSFSLLRLPRFQEFKKHRAKLDFVPNKTVPIREIAYRDKSRELHRQHLIREAVENQKERRDALKAKSKKMSNRARKRKTQALLRMDAMDTGINKRMQKVKKDDNETSLGNSDLDELNEEARLIKKVRRGKLSQQEFDREAGYSS
jgi:ATP-dependent RNA helicase DDX55/SPB4